MANYTPRRYSVYLKFESGDVSLFVERLSAVLNHLTKSGASSQIAHTANDMGMIFERGVLALEQEMSELGIICPDAKIDKALRSARTVDSRKHKLVELYDRLGLDSFVEFCEANGITDWQAVLEEYSLTTDDQEMTWTELSRRWLKGLLSDGTPRPTHGVKMAAIMSGVIDGSSPESIERDWRKLSVLAHREGYTSMTSRGEWKGKPIIG